MNQTQQQQHQLNYQHPSFNRHFDSSKIPSKISSSSSPTQNSRDSFSKSSKTPSTVTDNIQSRSDSTNSSGSISSTDSSNSLNTNNSLPSANSSTDESSTVVNPSEPRQDPLAFFANQQYSTFTTLHSIVSFAHSMLLKYSTNHSMLRMTLDCLDAWNSTIYLSLTCEPQALPAAAAAMPHVPSNKNLAFPEPHQNLSHLISTHVQSLLINHDYSYTASLQARSHLFVQCCLVSGNISCVSF